MPDFPFAQQRDDGESKHDRAQQEFLALVDIVLDEDAAIHRLAGDLQCKARIDRDDPGRDRHQRAGRQERDEYPHAARRALEMIEQERQHEQLRRGAQAHKSARPRTRPTTGFPATASATSAIGSAQIGRCNECRNGRSSSVAATAASQSTMPMPTPLVDHGNKHRDQDRDEIDVPHPRRRIVPGGKHRRQHRAERAHLVLRRRSAAVIATPPDPRAACAAWPPASCRRQPRRQARTSILHENRKCAS